MKDFLIYEKYEPGMNTYTTDPEWQVVIPFFLVAEIRRDFLLPLGDPEM